MTAVYVDASALVKLVVPEAETAGLQRALARHDEWVSVSITVTELLRATRRWLDVAHSPDAERAARLSDAEALARMLGLLDIDLPLVWAAGRVDPSMLRSLDALHLATAVQLADEIDSLITYDARLAAAATEAGLRAASPG